MNKIPDAVEKKDVLPFDTMTGTVLQPQKEAFLTPSNVASKINDFLNSFNSSFRMTLLNCKQSEREVLIYLLVSLKESVKSALEELGQSLRKRTYEFSCSLCGEEILLDPNKDIWTSLQDHEHFEDLFHQFLNGELEIRRMANFSTTSESESNLLTEDATTTGESNTDSGIEQQEMEPCSSGTQHVRAISIKRENRTDENVNSFRFNFIINYDERVENALYPPSIMPAIQKYDRIDNFTIMRVGKHKAVCFICNCDMNNLKVTRHILVNHALGQRHLRAATNQIVVQTLETFHCFWLQQEPCLQAHQVYFRMRNSQHMKCVLCGSICHILEVVSHIFDNSHERKVSEMYFQGINIYLLISLQVQAYGIIPDDKVEERETNNSHVEKAVVEEKKRPRKTSDDSDTADEGKKAASKAKSVAMNHNIIKSVHKQESTDPLELLPNRMGRHLKFLKKKTGPIGPAVWCDLCKCFLNPQVDLLKKHIASTILHASLVKERYKYYCEICDIRAGNEYDWLNHNFGGPRHVKMAESRKARVAEYECTTCRTVIFGDELSLYRHTTADKKRSKKERGRRLPDQIKKLFQSKEHILKKAAELSAEAEAVVANSLTQDCCARLQSVLAELFNDCKVYPFGSRISGMGNRDSDLDVFVDIDGTYCGEKNQEPSDQVLVIRKAVKAFLKNKEYANIIQVLTARTPILKLHHVPTDLACDLSFKHGLSVENTKFLRFCIELQPIVQQLILVVKKWAGLIGFENITTYALAIMCIFHLQVDGYLLSAEKVREINKAKTKSISGWKTINYVLSIDEAKKHIKPYTKRVDELLKSFFKSYSKFDFNSYVICPLLGRVVQRSLFSEGKPQDLPPEMSDYVAQLKGPNREIFRSESFMCVQDPFDLSHNLTKAAQQGTLKTFQTMCKLSLTCLESLK